MSNLTRIPQRNEPMIAPRGSGMLSRVAFLGSCIAIVYTAGAAAPLAAAAAVGAGALFMLRELQEGIEDPRDTELLNEILNARSIKHPSIWEMRRELRQQYPTHIINRGVEQIVSGECGWYHFKRSSKHQYRGLGELFCWQDPEDGEILLPYDALIKILNHWEIEPSLDVDARQVEETPQIPLMGGSIGLNTRLNALPVEAVSESPLVSDAVPVLPIPRNAAELLARLESECPELLKLVKAPPIRLVGRQRTGKSTFGRKLVLLRSILLPGHQVAWATPHREADNPVPETLNPFGTTPTGAKDFQAIETVWGAVQNAIDKGQQLNLSAVWDEFGSYDQFEDVDLLSKSLRSLLRESTKHGYHPLLVAHGDQSSFYPGVTGILGTLKESTVKVETIGRVVDSFGTMAPTGEVEVTHLDGSQVRFTVPDWLTSDLLLSLQPVTDKPAVLDAIAKVPIQPEKATEVLPVKGALTVGFDDPFDADISWMKPEPLRSDSYHASEVDVKTDIFTEFTKTLTHECQSELKSFVLWLSKKKGEQITFDQIKANWAKNAGVSRSKEVLIPLIHVAKSQRLLTTISDSNWKVAE